MSCSALQLKFRTNGYIMKTDRMQGIIMSQANKSPRKSRFVKAFMRRTYSGLTKKITRSVSDEELPVIKSNRNETEMEELLMRFRKRN